MPNQEPASAWIFGNSSVRVSTQELFRLYLKTFVPPFLPIRLTARSPRMRFFLPLEQSRVFARLLVGNYLGHDKNTKWQHGTTHTATQKLHLLNRPFHGFFKLEQLANRISIETAEKSAFKLGNLPSLKVIKAVFKTLQTFLLHKKNIYSENPISIG